MSFAVWPTDLPNRVRRPGFERPIADGRRLAPAEAGPMLGSLATTAPEAAVPCSVDLTLRQVGRFERFWMVDIIKGSQPFWIRDQVWDGVRLVAHDGTPLTTHDGRPLIRRAWWLCAFGQPAPKFVPLGGPEWRVGFSLRVLPK